MGKLEKVSDHRITNDTVAEVLRLQGWAMQSLILRLIYSFAQWFFSCCLVAFWTYL